MKAKYIVSAVILSSFLLSPAAAQSTRIAAVTPPSVPPSPVILPDGKVTFSILAPSAKSVTLTGDFPLAVIRQGHREETPLVQQADGVWSVTLGPLTPDVYSYAFNVDGQHQLDMRNAHVTRSAAPDRMLSWLIVPGAQSATYQTQNVPHGHISEVWFTPSLQGTAQKRVIVYTPPGYDQSSKRYPVFYLYHGGGEDETAWPNIGRAPQILDNLLAQGKIVPMIVVMPSFAGNTIEAPSDADETRPPAPSPPGQAKPGVPFGDVVAHDLIPFVDNHYRTLADRDHRAVAGTSAGGAMALITGLKHIDQFSWIGLLSPALASVPGTKITIPLPADAASRRGPDLGVSIDIAKFRDYFPVLTPSLNARLHLLYLSVGGDEGLLEEELAGRKAFDESGVHYTWVMRPHYGHEWAFWRQDLIEFSQILFKSKSSKPD